MQLLCNMAGNLDGKLVRSMLQARLRGRLEPKRQWNTGAVRGDIMAHPSCYNAPHPLENALHIFPLRSAAGAGQYTHRARPQQNVAQALPCSHLAPPTALQCRHGAGRTAHAAIPGYSIPPRNSSSCLLAKLQAQAGPAPPQGAQGEFPTDCGLRSACRGTNLSPATGCARSGNPNSRRPKRNVRGQGRTRGASTALALAL